MGEHVEDTWWSVVCGTVERVTGGSVYVRVKYPSLIPAGFDMQKRVVRYDSQHARLYLRKTPNR